jgi:hypothetical protein
LRWTGRNPRGRRRGSGRSGWAATCRGTPRVWGRGSGRLGFHSGARGVHPRRQHSREGAAMAGVGHGGPARLALPRASQDRQGRGKGEGGKGLTGGSRVAAREEVDDGLAALVG